MDVHKMAKQVFAYLKDQWWNKRVKCVEGAVHTGDVKARGPT